VIKRGERLAARASNNVSVRKLAAAAWRKLHRLPYRAVILRLPKRKSAQRA
jgi:DMSO/TMAO reductase YedYZ heme-binding membrane subunit